MSSLLNTVDLKRKYSEIAAGFTEIVPGLEKWKVISLDAGSRRAQVLRAPELLRAIKKCDESIADLCKIAKIVRQFVSMHVNLIAKESLNDFLSQHAKLKDIQSRLETILINMQEIYLSTATSTTRKQLCTLT